MKIVFQIIIFKKMFNVLKSNANIQMLQPLDPSLDSLQQFHIFPVLEAPDMDTVLQLGPPKSSVDVDN